MARINLLPWREELRKKKKKDFVTALAASGIIAIVIVGLIHMYIEGLKSYQDQRNNLLQKEIAELDKKIAAIDTIDEKKRKLLTKIELIQRLQESRPEIVHLFDEIPRLTPDGVYLKKLTQTGNDLVFEGKSQSNARVSAFMRAIEASPWLQLPKLDVIKLVDKDNTEDSSDFTLRAKQGKDTEQTTTANGKEVKR